MHPFTEIKHWIAWFWNECGKGGCKTYRSHRSRKRTIELLKQMADIRLSFQTRQPTAARRADFNDVKVKRHQMRSHKMCFACGAAATCRHHLIQLQHGGHNGKRNIVSLCDGCHGEIHPWLRDESALQNSASGP